MPRNQPSAEILDRLPPQDLAAERAVIGAAIIDPNVIDTIGGLVSPVSFYCDAHAKLYRHVVAMFDAGQAVDLVTLRDRLSASSELEAVGGLAYLAELVNSGEAIPAHAAYHATIVREKAQRRAVVHAATKMLQSAWDAGVELPQVLSDCEAELQRVQTGDYSGEPVAMDDALLAAMARIDETRKQSDAFGIATGLQKFDTITGGFLGGELVVLAARPSIGKTSLALQIADYNASKDRMVYVASLEMSSTDLAMRVLCGAAGVPMSRVRSARIEDSDMRTISEASAELHGRPVLLHDRPGLSVADIRRACRRLVPRGLSLIVVDYLQRLTPADRRMDRHLQVGQLTWDLKSLAMELKVPVLVLSQLGRAAEERDRKTGVVIEPRLSHLKESGDIEQDADVVLLLHRQQRATEATLHVAKFRNAEQAKFNLRWMPDATRFECDAFDGADPLLSRHSGDCDSEVRY